MAVKAEDVTYAPIAFAAIEVKGNVFFVNAAVAKDIKHKLTEELVFTSSENAIFRMLEEASEFVVDVANGAVRKPLP